jgi:hypothetical protein
VVPKYSPLEFGVCFQQLENLGDGFETRHPPHAFRLVFPTKTSDFRLNSPIGAWFGMWGIVADFGMVRIGSVVPESGSDLFGSAWLSVDPC